jgi:hypothetical protein
MADETSESAASESSEPTPASVETTASPSGETGGLSETHSKFAAVFKDATDDDTVEEASAETPATEEKPAEAKEESAAGEQQAAKPPIPAATPGAPVIPAAYTRSLKAYGWTDEEIKDAHKADPANFLRTAAKFHESRNEETRRLADLGRLAKQQAESQQTQTLASTPKFDVEALKKTYGPNEPIIKQMELLNARLEAQDKWVTQSQAATAKAEADALGRQIDGFFGSKDLTDYAEAYGKSAADMTPEQMTARQKVLETAELLIRGARQSGKTMSLEDALTVAHDSVSGPVKTQAVRKQIVEQAKTRNAAISLKPGTRATPKPAPGDRKVLETTVSKGLSSVFKG